MKAINKEETDKFCWEHRENGCIGVKGELRDEEGLLVNIAWRDAVTGEEIEVRYDAV